MRQSSSRGLLALARTSRKSYVFTLFSLSLSFSVVFVPKTLSTGVPLIQRSREKTMREQPRQRCCGDVGSQISRNHLKETGFLSDARSKDFGVASPSDTAEQTTSELTVVCAQRCASPANTRARTHRHTRRSDDYHRQSPRKRSGTPLAATPSIWHADYKGERESKKEESNGSFSVSFIIVPSFFFFFNDRRLRDRTRELITERDKDLRKGCASVGLHESMRRVQARTNVAALRSQTPKYVRASLARLQPCRLSLLSCHVFFFRLVLFCLVLQTNASDARFSKEKMPRKELEIGL